MEKLLTIGDVYQPPTANELASAYSANLQNRLARMQMAEYEKKVARESQRNELAKKYFTAGSPQIGTAGTAQIGTPAMPSETMWGVPQQSSNMMSTLGQSPTGPYAPDSGELSPFATRYSPAQAASPDYAPPVATSADYQAAVPAAQDMEGYQRALYGAGDVEGGMAMQTQVAAQSKAALDKEQATANLLKTYGEVDAKQKEQIYKKIELVGNMTAGVMAEYEGLVSQGMPEPEARAQAQGSYSQGVKYLVDNQINIGSMPPKFDPTATRQAANLMLNIKDRLAAESSARQDRRIGLQESQLAQGERRLSESERHNRVVESAAAKKSSTTPPDFRNEMLMRKEFLSLPEVKDYPTIEAQSNRALKALQEPSGNKTAVDQAIITTFNKMMDPSSVVRESEYARTPQDMALLNRIKGKWEKLASGGAGLTDEERQSMYRMVSAFKDIADASYNAQVEHYSGLASQYGYKPENVVRLGGRQMGGVSASGGTRPLPKF